MTAAEVKTLYRYYAIDDHKKVKDALEIIEKLQLRHIIILKEEKFNTLVSEERLLELDGKELLYDCDLYNPEAFATVDMHLFELFKKMVKGRYSLLPILENDQIIGATLFTSVSDAIINTFNLESQGGLVIIECLKSDYSLASIARVAETEGYQILMATTTIGDETNNVMITIKLNDLVNRNLLNALERYGYQVLANYTEKGFETLWKDRYESLMSYLNV